MNGFPTREQVERIKLQYPEGTRICCDNMPNDPRPIPPNTKGTVQHIDDAGTLHCVFDNGRQLGLIPGVDSFHAITLIDELRNMNEEELDDHDIIKFDSFEELFDYIYDENTDKEDIINDMSEKMKKELIDENYSERIMTDGKTFYYNSENFSELDTQQDKPDTEESEGEVISM